jgi:lipopolysaccharide transport system permease protein
MIRYVRDFFRYRELIELLTAREIKIRYKQSVLGILWALFQPAIMVILFTAIFTKIVRMPTGNIPYPVFFLSGLIPWTFFANSLGASIPSIVSNADLVKKIYFPRVILPLVTIFAAAFDFAVTFILLAILMLIFKIEITAWILFLPVIIFIQFVLTVGLALLFSALNVFYRDVKNALASVIQIWMFATPVIYPLDVIRPHLRKWLLLNPMTGIVDSLRKVLIQGGAPNWNYLAVSVIMTAILFAVAYQMFKRLEPKFADAI